MSNSSSPQVVGFYSRPYNEIVKPDQIWPVSKYFLRRWTPYLTPTRFWTVIAARQLAYRGGNKRCFEAYDLAVYQEACTSSRNYTRIKSEMEQSDKPISLFLWKEPTKYERLDEATRPAPTVYHVRLDEVLTPGDVSHLTAWLQTQKMERKTEAVVELLRHAITLSPGELLAPSLTPYLSEPLARFEANTVIDVIQRVFGPKIGKDKEVQKAADALHTHITGQVFIGTQYFRKQWLNILGAGPAFLLTYLRGQCYWNEETGEIRNEVTFSRPELADSLGIDRVTLFRWLKKIDEKVPPEQPFYPFLKLIDRSRDSTSKESTTYRVELHEPLTPDDLEKYAAIIQTLESKNTSLQIGDHNEQENPEGSLQNGDHTNKEKQGSPLQIGDHSEQENPGGSLQIGDHDPGENEEGSLQNGDHTTGNVANWRSQEGGSLQIGATSIAKWRIYKHLNTLIKALESKGTSTFAAAAAAYPDLLSFWKLEDNQATLSFAQAAVADFEGFCQAVNVQGRRSRNLVARSGLTLEQMVAWYLYVLTQNGIEQDMRPGYLVNRAREGEPPPAAFQRLATLSWELWRCYACLLELPHLYRDCLQTAPGYDEWMAQYGQTQTRELPFGVGEGVYEFMEFMAFGEQSDTAETARRTGTPARVDQGQTMSLTPPTDADRVNWQAALSELELQMTRATFNTWLKDAQLLGRDEGVYVIGVRNEYAQDWLTHRLHDTILRTLTAIIQEQVELRFVVWNPDTDSVNPAA